MRVGKHEKFHDENNRLPLSYVGSFFALAAIFSTIMVGFFGFYVEHWYEGPSGAVAKVFPIPAAVVEGEVIWYGDVVKMARMMDALREKAEIESGEPFDTALKRLIDDKQLEQFGESLGVNIAQSSIDNFELEEASLKEFLTVAHWSEKDYREFIVKPLLVAQGTEEKVYQTEDLQAVPRERIEKVISDLDSGFDFTDIASTRSDDLSAINNGHLGYFTKDELPILYTHMFEAEVETISEIIEGDDFFSIAKVVDVSGNEEERVRIALQIISINKDKMASALSGFKENSEVKYFVK